MKNIVILGLLLLVAIGLTASGDTDTLATEGDVSLVAPSDGQVLTFSGALSKWTNQTPAATLPKVVAHTSFSTDFSNQTIYTPTSTGDFRMSVYVDSAVPAPIAVFPGWTDGSGNGPSGVQYKPSTGVAGLTFVFHDTANNAITLTVCSTTVGMTCNSFTGNTYVEVEKLN